MQTYTITCKLEPDEEYIEVRLAAPNRGEAIRMLMDKFDECSVFSIEYTPALKLPEKTGE